MRAGTCGRRPAPASSSAFNSERCGQPKMVWVTSLSPKPWDVADCVNRRLGKVGPGTAAWNASNTANCVASVVMTGTSRGWKHRMMLAAQALPVLLMALATKPSMSSGAPDRSQVRPKICCAVSPTPWPGSGSTKAASKETLTVGDDGLSGSTGLDSLPVRPRMAVPFTACAGAHTA